MQMPRTIVDAAGAFRRGTLTPLQLVQNCLSQIDRYEPQISAWVKVDRDAVLKAAKQATDDFATKKGLSPLHGIPFGIKDIIDVTGFPTRAGSALTDGELAAADAPVVANLRDAGAIILGKTVTTEFACFDPPPTKNPWNVAHTPGGSSSGSAAALAMGMCLGAIGSQTGGSINRPASFCGVAGIKPTFGRVSRRGVLPVSFHLDHVGPMARTATDCGLILAAIAGCDASDPASSFRPGIELPDEQACWASEHPPRLGVVRPYFFDGADPEMSTLVDKSLALLAQQDATLIDLRLPDYFEDVHKMHRRIMACEAAEFHRASYGAPREGYGDRMRELIEEGLRITLSQYQQAMRHRTAFRNAVQRLLGEVDALVLPATPGPAPDMSTTGDARFNSPWSHAGVPTVSMPCGVTEAGLPVALQLVGEAWSEDWLLPIADWCEKKLQFQSVPPLLAQ